MSRYVPVPGRLTCSESLRHGDGTVPHVAPAHGPSGLSGVLASQASSVAEAYAEKFTLDPVAEREEWCRITGRRK